MKAISSSFIVATGAVLLIAGSSIIHSQTGMFVQVVGCAVGLLGLAGWGICMSRESD